MEDLYQERIGGAILGDVFSIGADDILSITIGNGLTKSGNSLAVDVSATGGLTFSSGDLGIKLKAGGGLTVDVDGLYSTVYSFPGVGLALSTGSAWGTSVTNNSANWNTAYGWGNHAGLYELTGAVSTHAALTTGIHGLAITAGQTLTVTTGGTLGSAAYTASSIYALVGQTMYIGTTGVAINRGSGALSLAGVSHSEDKIFNADLYTGSDTQKIQAAIDAAEAVNGTVYIPPRVWQVGAGDGGSMPFTVTAGIRICGMGPSSYIHSQDGTNHIFSIQSDAAVIMDDLTVVFAAAVGEPTAGKACIYVTDTNGDLSNTLSKFHRLTVQNGYYGFHFYRAACWVVDSCHVTANYYVGIKVENVYENDEGDSTICNSLVSSRVTATMDILQESSGGLRIVNNKILSNATYGIVLDRIGTGNTGILIIDSNSIEGQDTYGILLKRSSGARTFTSVIINANEIVSHASAIGQTELSWLDHLVITNNTIAVDADAYYGINLDGVADGVISGNTLRAYASGSVGILLSTNVSRIKVGVNHFNGWSTDITNNSTTSYVETLAGTITLNTKLHDIGALAATDSNFIVGNGTTWVAESGSDARTSLGLAIGTNVQAYNSNLTAINQALATTSTPTFEGIYATSASTHAYVAACGYAASDYGVLQVRSNAGTPVTRAQLLANNAATFLDYTGHLYFRSGIAGTSRFELEDTGNLLMNGGIYANFYALPNNLYVYGLNAAAAVYKFLIGIDSSDYVQVGLSAPSRVHIGSGGTDANPIYIRVGSADCNITAGANDSAVAGYRHLMVPNA